MSTLLWSSRRTIGSLIEPLRYRSPGLRDLSFHSLGFSPARLRLFQPSTSSLLVSFFPVSFCVSRPLSLLNQDSSQQSYLKVLTFVVVTVWTWGLSSESIGSSCVLGDGRWAGSYGVDADYIALTHCSVEFIPLDAINVSSFSWSNVF